MTCSFKRLFKADSKMNLIITKIIHIIILEKLMWIKMFNREKNLFNKIR